MDKRVYRDSLRFAGACLFVWLYLPHLLFSFFRGGRDAIADATYMAEGIHIKLKGRWALLYFLHNNEYFRSLFYYRIGPVKALLISWWRPGSKVFTIPYSTKIGVPLKIAHPFSTILNAESIGSGCSIIHNITIGKKGDKRPVIGNNVVFGAGCIVIGNVHIGDNVVIGAGAVVVKDVHGDCVVAGNPAKVIRK